MLLPRSKNSELRRVLRFINESHIENNARERIGKYGNGEDGIGAMSKGKARSGLRKWLN